MFEHEAAVRLNLPAQHLVMGGQRDPHPIGVSVPPTGRTLDVGERERPTTPEGAAARSADTHAESRNRPAPNWRFAGTRAQTPAPPDAAQQRYPRAGPHR